ncbi:MAG TPA: alpha/beta fold hydrolase [Gaiellaceae bacterium]
MRVHVFPYAGGAAAAARDWDGRLGPDVCVAPVALPGRDGLFNKQALTDHREAVAYLRRTLVPTLEPPFAFYGHSMGAHLAFEVARDLRRLGLPEPVHLFVSGASAPQFGPPRPNAHLPDDRFVARLRELGGTPDAVLEHEELLAFLLPLLRADFALAESYRYVEEPPLECPLSVWGGTDDGHGPERLEPWREQTTGRFRLRMLRGGHFFIRERRDELLEALEDDLIRSSPLVAIAS